MLTTISTDSLSQGTVKWPRNLNHSSSVAIWINNERWVYLKNKAIGHICFEETDE